MACEIGLFVKDYQTLIIGTLALIVAIAGLRPLYPQARLARLQTGIHTRELLEKRISHAIARRAAIREQVALVTGNLLSDIYFRDPTEKSNPDMGSEWAFNAGQMAERVAAKLGDLRDSGSDPDLVALRLSALVKSVDALSECLNDIHAPDSGSFDDPELGYTEDQIKTYEAEAVEASAVAVRALRSRIASVSAAADELDRIFQTNLLRTRGQLREINRSLSPEE